MIRVRFRVNAEDPRPVRYPIKHPYWVSGYSGNFAHLVAYVDDIAELRTNWPGADHVETEEAEAYVFTDRFPKPTWLCCTLVLLFLLLFTVPLSQGFESFSSKPGIGERGDRYIPGEPYSRPSPSLGCEERERLEGIEDQLERIRQMQLLIEQLERRKFQQEYHQRHFPAVQPWEPKPSH